MTFDAAAFRSAFEAGDVDALGGFVAEDVEWRVVDRKTPPAAPMVVTGRESLQAALRDIHGRGLTMRLEDEIVAGERAAYACRCRYPDGREVLSNMLMTTRDGRIARVSEVQAWDECALDASMLPGA
jgi:ketosteroid isomerase-like protein